MIIGNGSAKLSNKLNEKKEASKWKPELKFKQLMVYLRARPESLKCRQVDSSRNRKIDRWILWLRLLRAFHHKSFLGKSLKSAWSASRSHFAAKLYLQLAWCAGPNTFSPFSARWIDFDLKSRLKRTSRSAYPSIFLAKTRLAIFLGRNRIEFRARNVMKFWRLF